MKFGHTLYDLVSADWHPYAVNYKGMKKVLKGEIVMVDGIERRQINTQEFFRLFEDSKTRLSKFYNERLQMARNTMKALKDRVHEFSQEGKDHQLKPIKQDESYWNRMSDSISSFDENLNLLIEFLDLNKTGFSKILKKYDKRVGSSIRDEMFAELMTSHQFLDGEAIFKLKEELEMLQAEVEKLRFPSPEQEKLKDEEDTSEVADMLSWIDRNSVFFNQTVPRVLPKFKTSEVVVGRLLGEGEFGIVKEVSKFNVPESCHICFLHRNDISLTPEPSSFLSNGQDAQDSDEKHSSSNEKHSSSREHGPTSVITSEISDIDEFESDHNDEETIFDTRGYMKDHCFKNGSARYAIKRLRDGLKDDVMEAAACDLAFEAKLLASVQHPNIVKMRGSGSTPGRQDFLIVLDRLYDTLAEKCLKWREDRTKAKGLLGFRKDKKVLENIWVESMIALFDIGRALRYLHAHKIIYRDIKPENIGFDIRGDAKLFDFGLAKELLKSAQKGPDQYLASGMTGTRRYMAPEVTLCKPYGLSADVYSFTILMWEVLTLKTAFKHYNHNKHANEVVLKGKRPKLPPSWQILTRTLMEKGWSSKPQERPQISSVCDLLRSELSRHELSCLSTRSTDLLNKSDTSRYRDPGLKFGEVGDMQ